MLKKVFFITLLFCDSGSLFAQDSLPKNKLHISGYVEAYFCYDLARPADHERPNFVYNHKRSNEVNINLAYIKLNYETALVRSNVSMMAGTYPQYNLAAEQGLLKNLYEANVGIKLSQKRNVWIDAGLFPSHLGFESAVGKDCQNVTRSILADNSPYYEAGAKLNYTSSNNKWYLAVMYINGWQRIQRVSGNQSPDFGTQITYKTKSDLLLNWSTFIGNDQPDTLMKWRYFNNLFAQWNLSKKVGLTAGFDIGMEQKSKHSKQYHVWYSPVLIVNVNPSNKVRVAARAEYYSDKNQVIVYTGTLNGFQTQGYSLNLDYLPLPNVMFRVEARTFISKDDIFQLQQKASTKNYFFTTVLAISF